MFISLKTNKKRILAFLILAAVVVTACFLLRDKKKETPVQQHVFTSNEERVTFLQSFGWEIEPEPVETREVMIPEQFNDVYTAYNDMQKAQGFDLRPYAGYNCMQYKYLVKNYPEKAEVYATLLVYDQILLGGDLACVEVDGFMHGFAMDSARYGEKKSETARRNGETVSSEAESAVADDGEVANMEASEVTQSSETENVNADIEAEAGAVDAEVIPEEAYPTD